MSYTVRYRTSAVAIFCGNMEKHAVSAVRYCISWLVQRRNALRIITDCSWGKDSDIWSKLILSRSGWLKSFLWLNHHCYLKVRKNSVEHFNELLVNCVCCWIEEDDPRQLAKKRRQLQLFLIRSWLSPQTLPITKIPRPRNLAKIFRGLRPAFWIIVLLKKILEKNLRSDEKGQCSQKSNSLVHQPRPILPSLLDGLYTCLRQSRFNLNHIRRGV